MRTGERGAGMWLWIALGAILGALVAAILWWLLTEPPHVARFRVMNKHTSAVAVKLYVDKTNDGEVNWTEGTEAFIPVSADYRYIDRARIYTSGERLYGVKIEFDVDPANPDNPLPRGRRRRTGADPGPSARGRVGPASRRHGPSAHDCDLGKYRRSNESRCGVRLRQVSHSSEEERSMSDRSSRVVRWTLGGAALGVLASVLAMLLIHGGEWGGTSSSSSDQTSVVIRTQPPHVARFRVFNKRHNPATLPSVTLGVDTTGDGQANHTATYTDLPRDLLTEAKSVDPAATVRKLIFTIQEITEPVTLDLGGARLGVDLEVDVVVFEDGTGWCSATWGSGSLDFKYMTIQ